MTWCDPLLCRQIFFNEFNQDRVGYFVPGTTGANTLASRDLCCTNRMASENICSHAGHLVVAGVNANISAASFDDGDATPPVLTAYLLGADSPLEFQNKHIVKRSGEQTAMVVVCSTAFTITEEVELDLVAEFRNPYGYVPGIKYGYIIGYGILSASYLVRAPWLAACGRTTSSCLCLSLVAVAAADVWWPVPVAP